MTSNDTQPSRLLSELIGFQPARMALVLQLVQLVTVLIVGPFMFFFGSNNLDVFISFELGWLIWSELGVSTWPFQLAVAVILTSLATTSVLFAFFWPLVGRMALALRLVHIVTVIIVWAFILFIFWSELDLLIASVLRVPTWTFNLTAVAIVIIFATNPVLFLVDWQMQRFLKEFEAKRRKSELELLDEGDFEQFDQIRQLRADKAKVDFERNLRSTFVLERLELGNLSFFDHCHWDFEPGVNVILGRNGYGKSLILRFIAALLQHDEESSADLLHGEASYLELSVSRDSESASIRRESDRFTKSVGKVPILAVPDSRFPDRTFHQVGPPQDSFAGLREHGAHHFLNMKPYGGIVLSLIYEICLDYWEHGRSFRLPVFGFLSQVYKRLADERFEFKSIKRSGRTSFEINLLTEGTNVAVPIRYASQGTISILAMFGLIRSYLKALYPDEDEERVMDKPAIVIIDELDGHLHPLWQQRLTGLLRDMFPRVQFIVSAHSPLVAAGCLEREVAVLRKSSKGGFAVQQLARDFIGASARELYEELFDIEEPDETLRRYPPWKPMDRATLRRIRKLDERADAGKLTGPEQLERAQLLREDRAKRKAAEVLDTRVDEDLHVVKLQAEIERLRDQVRELGGDPPEASDTEVS